METNEIPFSQLVKGFCNQNEVFCEVTDAEQAISDIKSTASCTWGAGSDIGDSGWVQLASPSPRSRGDKRTVFVCRKSLVADFLEVKH